MRDASQVTFKKKAHLIPESLGSTDKYAPKGFECDKCNEAFSIIEQRVLNSVPFLFERIISGTLSKKGRYPIIDYENIGIKVEYKSDEANPQDRPFVHIDRTKLPEEYFSKDEETGIIKFVIPEQAKRDYYANWLRFLIKIGLGLLLFENPYDRNWNDPYAAKYDSSRKFSKEPIKGAKWELLISDVKYESRPQLGQYNDWIFLLIPNGPVIFCYKYGINAFVCNLDAPELIHYQDIIEQYLPVENSQIITVEI